MSLAAPRRPMRSGCRGRQRQAVSRPVQQHRRIRHDQRRDADGELCRRREHATHRTDGDGQAAASFTAAASGNPAPSVKWQVSTNGGSTLHRRHRSDIHDVRLHRGGGRHRQEKRFGLHEQRRFDHDQRGDPDRGNIAPAITTQPATQTVTAGGTATFTAAASGNPAPTVQWQVSANGGSTFVDVNRGGDSGDVFVHASQCRHRGSSSGPCSPTASGRQPRSAISPDREHRAGDHDAARQPDGAAGGTATFTAAASGTPTPTVQWQVSTDGGATFSDSAGRRRRR